MSWSLTVNTTKREDFAAAVDAAEATGQPADVIAKDVEQAKEAMKALAGCVKRPFIYATANGHSLEDGQFEEIPGEPNWHDGVGVALSGSFGPA